MADAATKNLDFSNPKDRLKIFRADIQAYNEAFQNWQDRGQKIVDVYRADKDKITSDLRGGWSSASLPIVWSNTEIMKPALYARTPKPECERKFKGRDPMGRLMAEILERVASFQVKEQQFDEVMRPVRDDYLLPGRGIARVSYEADIVQLPTDPEVEAVIGPDGLPVAPEEEVSNELVPAKYYFWKDFGHTVTRSWNDVQVVWFINYMEKDDFAERFPDKSKDEYFADHDLSYQEAYGSGADKYTVRNKCKVYELWSKKDKKVYFFTGKNGDEFLDTVDDPLKLKDFFPCPRPLFSCLTTDSLIPISNVGQYMNAVLELDRMLERRLALLSALKVTGVFDKAFPQLATILNGDTDLKLFPVDNFIQLKQSGGLSGAMEFVQIEQYVKALQVLDTAIIQQKAMIDEMSGVSDILRGASDPNETATAQQIKGRFATLRLEDGQREVQRFARDLIALMSECAIEHLSIETIAEMANVEELSPEEQQMFPEAIARLKDDRQRKFRISIETDSTIAVDEQAESKARQEAVQGVTGILKELLPIAGQAPPLLPAVLELAMFGMRAFPSSRSLEFSFEQAFKQLGEFLAQQKQNQPPDPAQVKAQMEQQKMQADLQMGQQKMQADLQMKQADMQLKQQEAQMGAQMEQDKAKAAIEMEYAKGQAQIQIEREKALANLEIEQMKASQKMQHDAAFAKQKQEFAAQQALSAPKEAP